MERLPYPFKGKGLQGEQFAASPQLFDDDVAELGAGEAWRLGLAEWRGTLWRGFQEMRESKRGYGA